MKTKFLLLLGSLALVPGLSAHAQTDQPARHRELTIWIPPKVGTLIGGGYASSYLTNIRSKTLATEDPELRRAINTLDELGMRPVRGFGLVPAAVSWQTSVPIHTLVEQQAQTDLSYGELLMVNSLAAKSGRTFDEIVALRTKSRNWADVAGKVGVDKDLVVTRARAASQRIRDVELRFRHRPQSADAGTSYTSVNPHTQSSRLH